MGYCEDLVQKIKYVTPDPILNIDRTFRERDGCHGLCSLLNDDEATVALAKLSQELFSILGGCLLYSIMTMSYIGGRLVFPTFPRQDARLLFPPASWPEIVGRYAVPTYIYFF